MLHFFSFSALADDSDDGYEDVSLDADLSSDVTADQDYSSDDVLSDELDDWYFHTPNYFYPVSKKWLVHNRTRLGFSLSRGNTHSFTVDGMNDLVVRKELFTNTFSFGALYSRGKDFAGSPSQTLSRFFIVEDKIEYALHKDYYIFSVVGWQTDRASGMEQDYKAQAGAGYNAYESMTHTIQLEGAYQFNREIPVAPMPKESIHSMLVGLDWVWHGNQNITFEQQITFIIDVQQGSNFSLITDSELTVRLAKHFGVAVGVTLNLDNQPQPGFKKYDLQNSIAAMIYF